jgi:hypothetical protein
MLKDQIDNLPESGPCDLPPTWGGLIPGDERFVATFGGAAYCDRQMGLVWEAAPDGIPME